MKALLSMCMFAFLVYHSVEAQFGIIPANHDHDNSICYGYAMGRAFGKDWSNPDPTCNIQNLNAPSVDQTYFQLTTSIASLEVGDILAFEPSVEGGTYGHVAYVSYVRFDGKYDVDSTRVDQVDGVDASEVKGIVLRDVIEGNVPNGINAHGDPVARYTKRRLWGATIKNQFSDADFGGTLRVVLPIQGEEFPGSPYTMSGRFWGETVVLDAYMNGTIWHGLTRTFLYWTGSGSIGTPSSQATNFYINWGYINSPEVKAVFRGDLVVNYPTTTIAAGETVTIGPTTLINIQANSELVVQGKLIVNGTSSNHVGFTSPYGTTWKGIRFEGSGANGSKVQYSDISNAVSPIVANSVGNLEISNVNIGNSSFYSGPGYAAMSFYGSSPTISNVHINGQSNSWNGVRFAQGSGGSITNSLIQDLGAGNGIVIEGNSTPTVSSTTIDGNLYHGIVVGSNSSYPTISGNTITDNGVVNGVKLYTGIDLNNGRASIMSNHISGSNYGIYAENYAYPRSWSIYTDYGGNEITGNLYGIVAWNHSSPDFGYADPEYSYGACNIIYSNATYNAYAASYSYISAMGDYWSNPPEQKFYNDATSEVDYSCYLESAYNCASSVCGGGFQAVPNGSVAIGRGLADAKRAYVLHDFSTAKDIYIGLVSESTDESVQVRALQGLYQVFLETKQPDLVQRVHDYKSNSGVIGAMAKELEVYMNIDIGNYDEAKQIATRLRSNNIDPALDQRILTQLAWLGSHSEKERHFSVEALTELKGKYGKSVDEGLLAAIGSSDRSLESAAQSIQTAGQLSLASYPNPFNPSTEIRYVLKSPSFVTLRIFDMLGREIQSLINTDQSAGMHTAIFDASRLASGLYFARISVAPISGDNGGGRIVETIRLLLTK